MLQDASGDIYIGHNDFDDSHLTSAVIKAQCSYCAKPGTKVEIVSNHFQGRDGDKPRTTVPPAVYLRATINSGLKTINRITKNLLPRLMFT